MGVMGAVNTGPPDRETILKHLRLLTRRWGEIDEKVVLELRTFGEHKTSHCARFSWDEAGLDMAAEHAEAMNTTKTNCYPMPNPVRADAPLNGNKGAKDEHIAAAFYVWIDCDEPDAASNVVKFSGPAYTFAVTTGTVPHKRPHIYWELSEPITDMDRWRALQVAMAQHFKSDGVVVNPSRVMRLAGTVNYPSEKKRQRGYIEEMVTLRTDYPEPRRPVDFEALERVFKSEPDRSRIEAGSEFTFDSGQQSLDREAAAAAAMSGEEWHNHVIRLVASYVSKGLSDAEIHGLTDHLTTAGYTVEQTRQEVQTAIDGARAKGWTPPLGSPTPSFDSDTAGGSEAAPDAQAEALPEIPLKAWEACDLSQIPYVRFTYSDFYARGYTSLTIAPPKVGKSMLALAEAIDMASGRGFLTGIEAEPLRVLYFNAEDDQDVINNRVAALLTYYDMPQSDIEGRLFPVSGVSWSGFHMATGDAGDINEKMFSMLSDSIKQHAFDVLVFDPLQDMSDAPETNEVFRRIGRRLRRLAADHGVSLHLVHHTRKIAPGQEISMEDARGGSALRGTARFNRALSPMKEEEGVKAGVPNHRFFFRIGDMESNLAPPSADVNRWFQKVSVQCPNGEFIGAVAPWKWPDAFDGIRPEDASRIRAMVDGMDEPPRADPRSADWIGNLVAEVLGLNISETKDKSRVKALVDGWVKTDVLRHAEHYNKRRGRDVPVIICGANNPVAEAGE